MGSGEDKSLLFFAAGSWDSKLISYAKLAYIRTIITVQQGWTKKRQTIDMAASKG